MAATSRRSGNTMISTIFFDLDNTLIPTRKGDRIACHKVQNILVEKYGFSPETAQNVTQTFLKNFRKCPENVQLPLHDWRHLLWKKALGDSHDEISGSVYCQWLNLRYKYLAPSAEVISLLESLRKKYYLALITNGPSNSQWEKIKRLHLTKYFHLILVSGDHKWEKPNEKIFLEACLHLGVSAEECIMVGDKLETDILGGLKAGLGGTVWIPLSEYSTASRDDHVPDDDKIVPDFTIDDVTQLTCLLAGKAVRASASFFGVGAPDLEDCNSNSSDGS